MQLILLSIMTFTFFTFAENVQINIVKIKLNSVDAMGMIQVNGGIKLLVDTESHEPKSILTEFAVKTAGIGITNAIKDSYDVVYNQIISLIQGDKVVLPGFNKELLLTSILIKEPVVATSSVDLQYDLQINFLKAFGKGAPDLCQKYETLDFKLQQRGLEFQLYYPSISAPVKDVKLFVETLGKEKKLSRLEIHSEGQKVTVEFKDCNRVDNSIQ